jgi:hypothetical protein
MKFNEAGSLSIRAGNSLLKNREKQNRELIEKSEKTTKIEAYKNKG